MLAVVAHRLSTSSIDPATNVPELISWVVATPSAI
jgi:hypothetical protein